MVEASLSSSAASTASSGVGGDFNVTSGGKLTWLPWVIVAGVVVFGLILFRNRF